MSPHLSLRPASFQSIGIGGDERVRTDDPLLAKQVLSQLSYTPIVRSISAAQGIRFHLMTFSSYSMSLDI